MSEPQYLRAGEIAELLGVNVRTVRRWIADGTLPSVKIGGARLVLEHHLLMLLGRQTVDHYDETATEESSSQISDYPNWEAQPR